MIRRATLAIGLLAVLTPGLASAQQPAPAAAAPSIKRTPLQRYDVPGTSMEAVIGLAEIPAGGAIGRHTHFGPEAGYLLDGELSLEVEGQATRVLRAGESYQIATGLAHDGRAGPAGAKVIATYIVEKAKPLVTAKP